MRILIGSVIQESNTFSPLTSTLDNFRQHHWLDGSAVLSDPVENELQGFIRAAKRKQVEVVPTISANAVSSGKLSATALSELQEILCRNIAQAGTVDGIYFAMHGAMVAEGCDDVEGELLAGIRAQVGSRIPLVVSLDLHANVTKRMVELADAIIGFRTFPHTDFAETGERAAELMFSMLEQGLRPHMALQKLPMIVPAENSQSSHGPFYELLTAAEHGVREGASLYTSLFPVQPWLDIEEMGSAVLVVGKDAVLAAAEAERVAAMFWEKRQDFAIQLHAVEEVLDDLARIRSSGDSQPIIASDSADSPSAGATGDSNVVLRELLRLGAHHRYRCYVMMVDAPAVAKATQAGEGEIVELEVGFTLNHAARYAEKLKLCGRVRRLGDGTFTLQGGYAKHTKAKMGRYAVVDVGSVSVLLTEKPTFSSDPGMYRSVGLEPTEADFVLVKSANQFRQDYEPISRHIYVLNTPGCSPADVKRLTYRKLEHPFYPFEDDFDWRNRE